MDYMKRILLLVIVLIFIAHHLFSQGIGIGTNTPDSSAVLDITHANKGLLIPRMSTTSINAINIPAKGLLVYDSLINQFKVNIGTPASAQTFKLLVPAMHGILLVIPASILPINL